jgi:DNA-binding CsgD family transcriptional regulator
MIANGDRGSDEAVWAATSSRMAGSLMAEYLGATLRRPVVASPPDEPQSSRVTVLLSAMEAPNTVPRMLRTLASGSSRVILSYDGAARSTDLLYTARRLGVWATFDARDDIRGLVDLVRRGLSASPTSHRNTSSLSQWHLPAEVERSGLTEREMDVIGLLCADEPLDTERAAQELGISVHTINVHLRNVRRKLDGRYTGNRRALRDALIDVGWLEC